jgi:hypothetical protein
LKEQLSKKVVSFVKELPFADLTIKSSQQYQGVVLTDDDLFYDARSVKESFAYLPWNYSVKGGVLPVIIAVSFGKRLSLDFKYEGFDSLTLNLSHRGRFNIQF